MSTLSDMRSRIADDLDRSDLSTQINKAINRAIEYYEKERFWFTQKTATFNTVANQKSYTSSDSIPTDIAEIDYVEVTISGTEYEVKPKTWDWIKKNQGYDFAGDPRNYVYYKENFWLYPIPNGTYVITVSYQKKYTALSSDSDTNDFTTDGEDLIEARARWWICKRILQDDELADSAKQEEMDALDALRAKTTKLIASNRISPTSF